MRHTRLMKNILLTTSICALLTTSVLAMEQKDTSDNAPKKDKGKEEKMADGENILSPQSNDTLSMNNGLKKIESDHMNDKKKWHQGTPEKVKQEYYALKNPKQKRTSPFSQHSNDDKGRGEHNIPSLPSAIVGHIASFLPNRKDVENFAKSDLDMLRTLDEEKNNNNIHTNRPGGGPVGKVGEKKRQEEAAEKIYAKLSTQNDPAIKLSLCMNLAKNGLFLLLSEDEQGDFIRQLSNLAEKNIEGARDAFLNLRPYFLQMTEGGQKAFIRRLFILAEKNITGAREVFLNLLPYFLQMTEGGQETFIYWLSYLAEDDEGARDAFFGLSKDMANMEEGAQDTFIRHLCFLARDNIAGARDAFFGLAEGIGEMKEGGQETFIYWLSYLAEDDEGARKAFLGLSNRIGEMKKGAQKEFIGRLYWLAEKNIEAAREVFLGLGSQKESMKLSVWEYYKKRLEELKKENN